MKSILLFALVAPCILASPQPQIGSVIDSIGSQITSVGGDITSVGGQIISGFEAITTVAPNVIEGVTSVGGKAVTVVTSIGGEAITLATDGAGIVTSFAGAEYTAATGVASDGAPGAALAVKPSLLLGLSTVLGGALVGAMLTL